MATNIVEPGKPEVQLVGYYFTVVFNVVVNGDAADFNQERTNRVKEAVADQFKDVDSSEVTVTVVSSGSVVLKIAIYCDSKEKAQDVKERVEEISTSDTSSDTSFGLQILSWNVVNIISPSSGTFTTGEFVGAVVGVFFGGLFLGILTAVAASSFKSKKGIKGVKFSKAPAPASLDVEGTAVPVGEAATTTKC